MNHSMITIIHTRSKNESNTLFYKCFTNKLEKSFMRVQRVEVFLTEIKTSTRSLSAASTDIQYTRYNSEFYLKLLNIVVAK